jgi:hypothetical protein
MVTFKGNFIDVHFYFFSYFGTAAQMTPAAAQYIAMRQSRAQKYASATTKSSADRIQTSNGANLFMDGTTVIVQAMQVDILHSDGVRLYDDARLGGSIDKDFFGFVNKIVGGHCFSMLRLMARTILEVAERSLAEPPLKGRSFGAVIPHQLGVFVQNIFRLHVDDGKVMRMIVSVVAFSLWTVH